MSRRHVVTFLTAPARSGKSFNEVRHICDEYIPNGRGIIYTNLPLHVEALAEWASKKYDIPVEEVVDRLHVIPREVETEWKNAGRAIIDPESGQKKGMHRITGPWEYFAEFPLANAIIIIDEIHNFCGSRGTTKALSELWQSWLGELGHNQAVFRCLSQAPEKVHACIRQEAQACYTIRNTGLDRDPYFKIQLYDWLELWAGIFNYPYRVFVFEQESAKVEGRYKKGERKLHLMGPPYFDFYDSFNKPIAHAQTENVATFEHEFEKHLHKGPVRGRLSLLRWFLLKNFYNVSTRVAMALCLIALGLFMMGGGMGHTMHFMFSKLGGMSNTVNEVSDSPAPVSKYDDLPEYDNSVLSPAEKDRVEKIQLLYEEQLRRSLIQVESLHRENERLLAESKKLSEELARLNAVVMLTPTSVTLRKGMRYEIGEEIEHGEYKGRKISAIDYRRRQVGLDDGTVLHLLQ